MATTYQIILHALPMGGRDNQKDTQQQWLKKEMLVQPMSVVLAKLINNVNKQLDTILQDRVLSHGPF
jgi:hypothetical protein